MSIRPLAKEMIGSVLYRTGLLKAADRRLSQAGVVALSYHNVSSTVFRTHADFLSKHTRILDPNDFRDEVSGQTNSHQPMVVLTFDDGYRSFVTEIHPILESHGFHALWFIPTNYLDSGRVLWVDQVQVAIETSLTDKISIGPRVWKLPKRGRRYTAYQIKAFMKSARPDLLDSMVEEILDQTGRPPNEVLKNYILTSEGEIQALDGRGVHIASHSRSHRNLTSLSDVDLKDELVGSKQHLEFALNRKVLHFAFPSGDHDERVLSGVRSAGYHWAWTTAARYINAADLPYQIPRVLIDDNASVATLAAKISPLIHRIGLVK